MNDISSSPISERVIAVEGIMGKRFAVINHLLNHRILEFVLLFNINYVLAAAMGFLALGAELSPNNSFLLWVNIHHHYSAHFWSWSLGMAAIAMAIKRPKGTFLGVLLTFPLDLLILYNVLYLIDRDNPSYPGNTDFFGIYLQLFVLVFIVAIYFYNAVVENLKNAVWEQRAKILELEDIIANHQTGGHDVSTVPPAR